jgi:hypothetical protein
LFSDIFIKMGTVHASLQVVNNTDTDITTISVSSVDGFDWKDHSSPDLIFKGVSIGAKRSEERQLAIQHDSPFSKWQHRHIPNSPEVRCA